MSEIKIKDGTGGSYIAKVDSDNRVWASSESFATETVSSIRGNSYVFHTEAHLAAASSGGLCYITNTSTNRWFAVTSIFFDAHTLTEDIKVLQVLSPATTSNGTDISATGFVQKNLNKANVGTVTFVTSDGSSDMTYTGGTQYHAFSLPSKTTQQRNMSGSTILGLNDTLLFGWETLSGSSATDGQTVGISINGYYFDPTLFGES